MKDVERKVDEMLANCTEEELAALEEYYSRVKSPRVRLEEAIAISLALGLACFVGYKLGTMPSSAGRALAGCRK